MKVKIVIAVICFFFIFETSKAQIFKAKCIISGISIPGKENSFLPSACSDLIVYDNSLKRVYIYKSPEETYDLISSLSEEKDKNDSSLILFTFQGIDKDNTKCMVILGETKKGLERLSITYQNKIFSYVMVPLE